MASRAARRVAVLGSSLLVLVCGAAAVAGAEGVAPAASPVKVGDVAAEEIAPTAGPVGTRAGAEGVVPTASPTTSETGAAPATLEADRRRPGRKAAEGEPPLEPLREYESSPFISIPDRWRIVENVGVRERWWDPYNQNTLKGDRPVRALVPWLGPGWFANLGLVSDTLTEGRRLPVPVGGQATGGSGNLDVFGKGDQVIFAQSVITELALTKGNTTFRPPDHELRLLVVSNYNHVTTGERGLLNVNPEKGRSRDDAHVALQEFFYDRHLRNVSEWYDFDSLRVGIQGFNSDFRGFLYQDSQPGIRLFGNRLKNRLQYNLAWFRRLEKNTNSGLNTVFDARDDDVVTANLYFQDFLRPGLTASAIVLYNRNRDRGPHYNENGFLERPAPIGTERSKAYDIAYLGHGLDGRLGPVNLTANGFLALGEVRDDPVAARPVDVLAYLFAAEGSMDFDWARVKLFGLHSSGDEDPFDDEAQGFDSVFENPQFAGAETGYWHRQTMPLVGGGGLQLSARNALLPALRTSKEEGQSNFVNPGLWMAGAGSDLDLTPEVRLTGNLSYLAFDETAILETLRQQGNVANSIGWDLSAAVIWRPLFNQNIVVRASAAVLFPGEGLDDLYDDRYSVFYSALLNVALVY